VAIERGRDCSCRRFTLLPPRLSLAARNHACGTGWWYRSCTSLGPRGPTQCTCEFKLTAKAAGLPSRDVLRLPASPCVWKSVCELSFVPPRYQSNRLLPAPQIRDLVNTIEDVNRGGKGGPALEDNANMPSSPARSRPYASPSRENADAQSATRHLGCFRIHACCATKPMGHQSKISNQCRCTLLGPEARLDVGEHGQST
jgi:hypothetical protein